MHFYFWIEKSQTILNINQKQILAIVNGVFIGSSEGESINFKHEFITKIEMVNDINTIQYSGEIES